ncbi:MAG: DUF5615 family PIN-like protein [Ardenticatenaceae bacterium]|nr:DUF5615 family PIN-like protein [Ardenticatenaceae bacterium]
MSKPKLYLDEDVWTGLSTALQKAGFDVVTVSGLQRKGFSDEAQLAFATAQGRAILSHNIQDFAPLAVLYAEDGREHCGIIVARQFDKGVLIRRTLDLLNALTAEQLANTLRFI